MLNELNFKGLNLDPEEIRKATRNVLGDVLEAIEMEHDEMPLDDVRAVVSLNEILDAHKPAGIDIVCELCEKALVEVGFSRCLTCCEIVAKWEEKQA